MAKKRRRNQSRPKPASVDQRAFPRLRGFLSNKWAHAVFVFGATMSASFFSEPFWPLGSWKWLFLGIFFVALYFFESWLPWFMSLRPRQRLVRALFAVIVIAVSGWLCSKWLPGSPPEKDSYGESIRQGDRLIADEYFYVLSEFLVRFRFNLHMLKREPSLNPPVVSVFNPGTLAGGVKVEDINEALMEGFFMRHDLKRTVLSTGPVGGAGLPSNAEVLQVDLDRLAQKCGKILDRYAGAGSPTLIQRIRLTENRAENRVQALQLKIRSTQHPDEARSLAELFVRIRDDLQEVGRIRGE